MPGIHFARVRAMIPLAEVLNLVGFVPCETSGTKCAGRVRSIIPPRQ